MKPSYLNPAKVFRSLLLSATGSWLVSAVTLAMPFLPTQHLRAEYYTAYYFLGIITDAPRRYLFEILAHPSSTNIKTIFKRLSPTLLLAALVLAYVLIIAHFVTSEPFALLFLSIFYAIGILLDLSSNYRLQSSLLLPTTQPLLQKQTIWFLSGLLPRLGTLITLFIFSTSENLQNRPVLLFVLIQLIPSLLLWQVTICMHITNTICPRVTLPPKWHATNIIEISVYSLILLITCTQYPSPNSVTTPIIISLFLTILTFYSRSRFLALSMTRGFCCSHSFARSLVTIYLFLLLAFFNHLPQSLFTIPASSATLLVSSIRIHCMRYKYSQEVLGPSTS